MKWDLPGSCGHRALCAGGFQVFLAGEGKLVVPVPAETFHKRLAQELIGAQAFGPSEHLGALTYLPAVEVDGREIPVLGEAHGVEGA